MVIRPKGKRAPGAARIRGKRLYWVQGLLKGRACSSKLGACAKELLVQEKEVRGGIYKNHLLEALRRSETQRAYVSHNL